MPNHLDFLYQLKQKVKFDQYMTLALHTPYVHAVNLDEHIIVGEQLQVGLGMCLCCPLCH